MHLQGNYSLATSSIQSIQVLSALHRLTHVNNHAATMPKRVGLPDPTVQPHFRVWNIEDGSFGSKKRKSDDSTVPLDQAFPDDEWYTLRHDDINREIEQMCYKLTVLVLEYSSTNPEIARLAEALKNGYIILRAIPFMVAFLGEQGIGKSTIINMLFNRELVTRSPGSKACASFPTYIVLEESFPDDTKRSNVTVETVNDEQMADSVEQQIIRFSDAFLFTVRSESDDFDEQAEDAEGDDEGGDAGDDAATPHSRKSQATVKKAAARTAREFFEIVFDAQQDEKAKLELDDLLHNTDIKNAENIRDGSLFKLCIAKVEQCRLRLADLGSEWRDNHDKDFRKIRNRAHQFWPLVEGIYIATGHPLLRHGLGFVDVPGEMPALQIWLIRLILKGYGDSNQVRDALIDKCRDTAQFEVVVTPISTL